MNRILEKDLLTLTVHDYEAELTRDVRRGMQAVPKTLPSKYFYDRRGGELFERITELPEYYLTRAEMSLIRRFAADILGVSEAEEVLEIGAGSADKICLLLDAGGDHAVETYSALDVNGAALRSAGHALQARHPDIAACGYVGDFVSDLAKIPPADGRRLLVFFGSTIGNLDAPSRAAFFRDVGAVLGPDGAFLLGADLVKDRERLRLAYDDPHGVTAEFTRNILRVVNRELDADFPVDAFEHVPRWNERELRMEAWLRAPYAMSVRIAALGLDVGLAAGEEILTEVSCKFTREILDAELAGAGLALHEWYTDESSAFALALAVPGPGAPAARVA